MDENRDTSDWADAQLEEVAKSISMALPGASLTEIVEAVNLAAASVRAQEGLVLLSDRATTLLVTAHND